ncbi:UNVERIFIED_CONTAM: hypothetical protein GTU68_004998 [Idotea baltica]|nr:hypothetical protein [Idotea baltica]
MRTIPLSGTLGMMNL